MSKKVELIAHNFAKQFGMDSVPWFKVTWFALAVYIFLTLLAMLFRPDMINVSSY